MKIPGHLQPKWGRSIVEAWMSRFTLQCLTIDLITKICDKDMEQSQIGKRLKAINYDLRAPGHQCCSWSVSLHPHIACTIFARLAGPTFHWLWPMEPHVHKSLLSSDCMAVFVKPWLQTVNSHLCGVFFDSDLVFLLVLTFSTECLSCLVFFVLFGSSRGVTAISFVLLFLLFLFD